MVPPPVKPYLATVRYFRDDADTGGQVYEDQSRQFETRRDANAWLASMIQDRSKHIIQHQMFKRMRLLGTDSWKVLENSDNRGAAYTHG